jgi:hypothetical protein
MSEGIGSRKPIPVRSTNSWPMFSGKRAEGGFGSDRVRYAGRDIRWSWSDIIPAHIKVSVPYRRPRVMAGPGHLLPIDRARMAGSSPAMTRVRHFAAWYKAPRLRSAIKRHCVRNPCDDA